MLAPIVMGAAGRAQRSQDLDPSGLAQLLQGEEQRVEQSSNLGGLASLLDMDGDGQVADDVLKLGSGLLGGLFRKR